MSILTTISGVPLFSEIFEARSWAIENGCRGHHVHRFRGQNGYMGCSGHSQALGEQQNTTTTRVIDRNTNTTTGGNMNRPISGGGGTSGGGGY